MSFWLPVIGLAVGSFLVGFGLCAMLLHSNLRHAIRIGSINVGGVRYIIRAKSAPPGTSP